MEESRGHDQGDLPENSNLGFLSCLQLCFFDRHAPGGAGENTSSTSPVWRMREGDAWDEASDTAGSRGTRPASRPHGDVIWNTALLASMILEGIVLAPTLYAECVMMDEMGPASSLIRIAIAFIRLMPAIVAGVRICKRWHRAAEACMRVSRNQRLAAAADGCFALWLFPEVHWGFAITLDMWYLLITPLEYHQISIGALIIANIVLCCMDVTNLICSLAWKNIEDSVEPSSDPENFHQPKPFVINSRDKAEGEVLACSICLCDFEEQDDDAVQLPCSHVFHRDCVERWLQRSCRCPLRCPQLVSPLSEPSQPSQATQAPALHRSNSDQAAAVIFGMPSHRGEVFIPVLPGEAHAAYDR